MSSRRLVASVAAVDLGGVISSGTMALSRLRRLRLVALVMGVDVVAVAAAAFFLLADTPRRLIALAKGRRC